MSQETQTPEALSARNARLLDEVQNADDGILKNSSEATTNLIRRRVRENGFARTIIPPKTITRQDLTPLPDTEMPVIVEEMETETYGARTISFDDAPDVAPFNGQKFVIYFFGITTPEFVKNVFELMTYKNDFRQITTDNALRDIQHVEDGHLIGAADTIVGTANASDGAAGYEQNHETNVSDPSQITRADFNGTTSYLEDHDLNNALFLVNRRSWKVFGNMDRSAIGGDLAQDIFKSGLSALQEQVVFGIKHAATLRRDLVPNYVTYQFTEPNFLGRFYILQDVTMHVEKKRDMIRFSAGEKIGMALPNVAGIHKHKFV